MNDAQARGALEAILFVAGEAVQLEIWPVRWR